LFEYDALKAAVRTASRILGPTGKPLNVSPDTLVVSRGYGPHLRALEILGAVRRDYIPGSADRDAPGVAAYKVIAIPWITTNTGYWWMLDSRMKGPRFGLQYKESQPIELEGPNKVFRTGEIQFLPKVVLKLSLINGENPEVDNAQEPQKGLATTKREGLLKRVCNSLNTTYNFIMKVVNRAEMTLSYSIVA